MKAVKSTLLWIQLVIFKKLGHLLLVYQCKLWFFSLEFTFYWHETMLDIWFVSMNSFMFLWKQPCVFFCMKGCWAICCYPKSLPACLPAVYRSHLDHLWFWLTSGQCMMDSSFQCALIPGQASWLCGWPSRGFGVGYWAGTEGLLALS